MKISKIVDNILTGIGYVLAVAPYALLGIYTTNSAEKLVTDENLGLELMVMCGLILLGVLFFYIHIILHEGGHLIGGLLSGWKYLSFRVGNLVLVRQNGKWEWKKMTVMGTGGQCLMIPPECEYEKCPVFLYLLGGGIVNLLTGGVAFAVGLLTDGFIQTILVIFAIMGIGLGLSNLFPAKLSGIMNDGYQIFVGFSNNSAAKTYMYCLLTANAIFTEHDSTKALPENVRNMILSLDESILNDTLATNLLIFKTTILREEGRYEEATEIFKKIVASPDTLAIFKNEANCELLYDEIMGECDDEKIMKLCNKQLMNYIKATSIYPARKRLMYAYYLIYEGDEVAADKEYLAFLKAVKTYPTKAEIATEIKEIERIKSTRQ